MWAVGGLTDLANVIFAKRACTRAVEWAGALSWWSCSCSLGHCEYDSKTVHKLWRKPEVSGSQIWAVGGLTELADVMLCQKSLHESCRMSRLIVVMNLICSLGHCKCDGHTVHKLSQWSLTADWLAHGKVTVHSKVSSDWLLITSRPRDRFSRYSKWPDTFRTVLV